MTRDTFGATATLGPVVRRGGDCLHILALGRASRRPSYSETPAGFDKALAALSAAALPCGLMAVGAALSLGALGRHARGVTLSVATKFLALPLLSLWAGRLLGLPAETLSALVRFQAQPTATASYVLARQLGGDADLMASIVTAQTLLAFAVLPAAAGLLAG